MLSDKAIIVTGAGGGLGEAIARVCHREGARVVIADIRGQEAERVAAELDDRACSLHCDVGDEGDRERLVQFCTEVYGRIDGLVNNAGLNFAKPFLDTTLQDWQRIIRVDLEGVFFLTQLVAAQMLQQQPPGGSVVNISSVHSLAAVAGAGPYDAAKCGVLGMSRSMAVELAPQGVRVNVLSPGLLNTQIWQDVMDAAPDEEQCLAYWKANIPIGRVIEPEEIAQVAAFLLSERAACITGANFVADGGMTAQLISRQPYESKPLEG